MSRNVRKKSAPTEDSEQPAHLRSMKRIFTGRILYKEGCKVSSCGQRRLCSGYVEALAHMSEGTFSHVDHMY